MIIPDFTNQLHIRMYVAELLKDHVKEPDFIELFEKMTDLILKGSDLPIQPEKKSDPMDFIKSLNTMLNGPFLSPQDTPKENKTIFQKAYEKYKGKNCKRY